MPRLAFPGHLSAVTRRISRKYTGYRPAHASNVNFIRRAPYSRGHAHGSERRSSRLRARAKRLLARAEKIKSFRVARGRIIETYIILRRNETAESAIYNIVECRARRSLRFLPRGCQTWQIAPTSEYGKKIFVYISCSCTRIDWLKFVKLKNYFYVDIDVHSGFLYGSIIKVNL